MSNYTWDDGWFDFMFAHTDAPEDAWQKLLRAPGHTMPRFPLDAEVTVGCKPLNSAGTRYKALGNSMAVPVMVWIGHRINLVEKLMEVK